MSTDRGKRSALIVGAGISGLVAAAALGSRGWQVEVIERKPEVSDGGGVGLTLVANALRALETLGLADKCVAAGVPADKIAMCTAQGALLAENPLPRIGGPNWPGGTGITRAAFHAILVEAAQGVATIRCNLEVADYEEQSEALQVKFTDGSQATYDVMIAAEGLYSETRRKLMPGVDPVPTGQASWRVPVRRPADMACTNLFVGGAQGLVGICPVSVDLAYMYIVQAHDGTRREPGTLHEQFHAEMEGYGGVIPELVAQVIDPAQVNFRPLESLVAPNPWYRGRIVLIGDAAHANPPVLAQGAAMGIEDAVVLAEELSRHEKTADALDSFMQRRFERVRHVVEASCQLARWEAEKREDVDVGSVIREATLRLAEPM